MLKLTEELHDELESFDPSWRGRFSSVGEAARAAGVLGLYTQWLQTDDGRKYLATIADLPDHVGDSKREVEAMRAPDSLPFGYSNVGYIPETYWGDDES